MTSLPAPKTTTAALAAQLTVHPEWTLPMAYLVTSLLLGLCAMLVGRTYVPALYQATHGGTPQGYRLVKPLAAQPTAIPASRQVAAASKAETMSQADVGVQLALAHLPARSFHR